MTKCTPQNIVIIELGCANTASIQFAFERLSTETKLSSNPDDISHADKLILPGVGAASFAMSRIHQLGLYDIIRKYERPLLGICLGQQLLFEASDEGNTQCLGLIKGRVKKMIATDNLVIPHMGWNEIQNIKPDPLTHNIAEDDYAYFVHSYACPIGAETLATCSYTDDFAAMVRRDNIWGAQFHPERSSEVGAHILRNFLKL